MLWPAWCCYIVDILYCIFACSNPQCVVLSLFLNVLYMPAASCCLPSSSYHRHLHCRITCILSILFWFVQSMIDVFFSISKVFVHSCIIIIIFVISLTSYCIWCMCRYCQLLRLAWHCHIVDNHHDIMSCIHDSIMDIACILTCVNLSVL